MDRCEDYTAWSDFDFSLADKTYFGIVVLFLELFLFPSKVGDKNNRKKSKQRILWTLNFAIFKRRILIEAAKLKFSVMQYVSQFLD